MAIRDHEGAVKQQAWKAAVSDAALDTFLFYAGPPASQYCLLPVQIPIRLSLSSNEVTSSQGPPPLYVSKMILKPPAWPKSHTGFSCFCAGDDAQDGLPSQPD